MIKHIYGEDLFTMSILDWFIFGQIAQEKTTEIKEDLENRQKQIAQLQKPATDTYSYVLPSNAVEIFRWRSLSRVYLNNINKKKAYGLCLFILMLIILTGFLTDWIFALVILLVIIVLALFISIKPSEVENIITDKGIYTSEIFFPWEMMKDFNISKLLDFNLLVIETKTSRLSQIETVIKEKDINTIREAVSRFLPTTKTLRRKWVDYVLLLVARLTR
ncbi:hypothetical protein A2Y99_01605 [Candidatus Gottesmanbacteria bacterium RBG_13_37_7]|uniref:DUF5673 domain-containing protein n=1 Tax=Candidatus Gottesmanbacteria bacterium RBG_13_37_7 TaxID=1798369 RepID=A0A1F5YIJ9_9BACT|nr:MAG: hypothetical protein A2Y99_01605 [Candidatus Gottesmanbacteria bacterium RBG_13_37_7]